MVHSCHLLIYICVNQCRFNLFMSKNSLHLFKWHSFIKQICSKCSTKSMWMDVLNSCLFFDLFWHMSNPLFSSSSKILLISPVVDFEAPSFLKLLISCSFQYVWNLSGPVVLILVLLMFHSSFPTTPFSCKWSTLSNHFCYKKIIYQ